MSFFDKIFQQLFPEKKEGTHRSVPMVSEQLLRKEHEKQGYFKWLNESGYRRELEMVYRAYQLKRQQQESDIAVHVLATQYANGFAVTFSPFFTPVRFQHLFDFLKDQVLEQGYRISVSDRKIFDRPQYVETIEKYYLKPPLSSLEKGKLIDQKFGNVLIEHVLIDGKPSYIKLMANIYSDRLYTKALPFEGLVNAIFIR